MATPTGRRFVELRVSMLRAGVNEGDLARICECSRHTITRRMTGETEWPLEDMYRVMDAVFEPYENISEIFPRHGKA